MLNIDVCYPPPVISGPIALVKLNTHTVVGTWASFSIASQLLSVLMFDLS